MTISLDEHTLQYLLGSIRQFFAEELNDDIGDLKARSVLDFFIREVGPSVYNQAVIDAQTTMALAVADLAGTRYEPEFNYWKQG